MRPTLPPELLLDRLFAEAPVGLGFIDADLHFAEVNPALAAMNGLAPEDHAGRRVADVLGGPGESLEALFRQVLETRQPVVNLEVAAPPATPGGPDRHFLASYAPVVDATGEAVGVVAVVQDMTNRRQTEVALERALEHVTSLQQVTASLSAALTVGEVADVIVRQGMEVMGASCGILARLAPEGDRLIFEHRFGLAEDAPTELPMSAEAPMPEAVRTGLPVVLASRAAWEERFPRVPPRSAFEGFTALPLSFEGRSLGAMALGFAEVRPLAADQLALLVVLARQGAQALERARLYEERAHVAQVLQRGLLPADLAEIPGMDLAVSYRASHLGGEVGGDFYDVVELAEGSWLAVLGDVCGKGIEAAVLSGAVRTTIASLALQERDPDRILELTNGAVLRRHGQHDLVTVVAASLTASADGRFLLELTSAGHPAPLVLRAGGDVESVTSHGMMLGVRPDVRLPRERLELGPGDTLVLYTDGVTEAGAIDGSPFGVERLLAALGEAAGGGAQEIALAVENAVRRHQPGPPRDDKALLVMQARR